MWGCHGASLRGCFFAGALYDGKMKTEHCCKCRIKGCIEDKGLAYCYECPEHPCRLTKDLEKSYKKRYQVSLVENSEFAGRYGLERFMEEQKEKYTCPICGGVISVHDRECSECQEKV